MNSKLTYLLLLISLISGFILALLSAGVHSTFFILVPILAFITGYYSSWRWGLACSLLLFASYTFTTALMWEVRYAFVGISQYFIAFFSGGFIILIIGALAPIVRKGINKLGVVFVLLLLAGAVGGCCYLSIPRYEYDFGIYIMCNQDMELYLPASESSDDLATILLESAASPPGDYTRDWYNVTLENTEYGQMWRLKMYSNLNANPDPRQPGRSSNWYLRSDEVFSWPGRSPVNMFQLSTKLDGRELNIAEYDDRSWPAIITGDRILEEFVVPVKVKTENPTEFVMDIYYSISKTSWINIGYYKTESYSQRIKTPKGTTGNDWVMVQMQAEHNKGISGPGD